MKWTISAEPTGLGGRCLAEVGPNLRRCHRQGRYRDGEHGTANYCYQHHPDPDAAYRLVEKTTSKAQLAFDVHDELLEAARFAIQHAFERKWPQDEKAYRLLEDAIAKADGRRAAEDRA